MADLSIRQATQEDFDDVMEVGEDLPGVDYLWCRYHSFLADPNAQCYVGTINNEVAFCSAFLIDDRQTYIIRAARFKAGFRGQGVYVKMLEHIRQEFKNVPRITRDAVMLNTHNFVRMKGRLLQTYEHILSRTHKYFRLKQPVSSMKTTPFVHEMTSEEMITFGTSITSPSGTSYLVDVYGNDVTGLYSHMLRHIKHAQSLCAEKWSLEVSATDDETLHSNINKMADLFGLVEETGPFPSLHFLAKPFPV